METFLIKAAQLILSLSLLVFVHELGHFGFARLFKVRVDKFYLFFNPSFSIVRFKKFNGKFHFKWFAKNLEPHVIQKVDSFGIPCVDKKGKPVMVPAPIDQLSDDDWRKHPEHTEWGLGWLPLGGYCKIAGMVDESMDTESMNEKAEPWEYRSRPAWQRLLIIIGGVLMNFITAIVIYAVMLFTWGEEYLPVKNAYLGYDYCQTALNNGFQNGDLVISVNNEPIETEQELLSKIVIEGKQNVLVNRNGKDTLIVMPKDFGEQMLNAEEKGMVRLRVPFVIDLVSENSPAEIVGIQKGDSIVMINSKATPAYSDVVEEFTNFKGETILLGYYRNGELMQDSIQLTTDGKLGIQIKQPYSYFETERNEYGFFSAIPAGLNKGVNTLSGYIKQFRLVFTKAGAQSIGGFGSIGNLFPSQWNWYTFWSMTAFLSIILAFMNILPIPVLDGGYVLFLIYEMITRRKPSDKFMEISLNIGMLLLLALLIFANGNDVLRLFR